MALGGEEGPESEEVVRRGACGGGQWPGPGAGRWMSQRRPWGEDLAEEDSGHGAELGGGGRRRERRGEAQHAGLRVGAAKVVEGGLGGGVVGVGGRHDS